MTPEFINSLNELLKLHAEHGGNGNIHHVESLLYCLIQALLREAQHQQMPLNKEQV